MTALCVLWNYIVLLYRMIIMEHKHWSKQRKQAWLSEVSLLEVISFHDTMPARLQPPGLTILHTYCTGGTECSSYTPGGHSVRPARTSWGVNWRFISVRKRNILPQLEERHIYCCEVKETTELWTPSHNWWLLGGHRSVVRTLAAQARGDGFNSWQLPDFHFSLLRLITTNVFSWRCYKAFGITETTQHWFFPGRGFSGCKWPIMSLMASLSLPPHPHTHTVLPSSVSSQYWVQCESCGECPPPAPYFSATAWQWCHSERGSWFHSSRN